MYYITLLVIALLILILILIKLQYTHLFITFCILYCCWRKRMDSEMLRILAAEVTPHHNVLKQIQQPERKEIFQAFDQRNPIIIQYGSETIKVGYDNFNHPNLVFRPQVSKTRDPSKGQLPIKNVMNLSYDQLDFSKYNYKSPFEKNIILHFSILEQCNDYIFSQILRPGKKTQSPLIISEPFANPIHCRSSILGQLFQCYGVNQILLGVDALFAYFYEVECDLNRYLSETALIVEMGANTIHVFCVLKGKVQFNSVRRVNVGGNNAFQLFSRSILLKNPQLKNKLTYSFLRDVYEKYTRVAYDYKQQLRYFERKITEKKSLRQPISETIYHNKCHQQNKQYIEHIPVIQMIEIDFDIIVEIPEEQIRRKQQMKIRMAQKLRQTIQRRKQIKKKMHEHELKQLQTLKQKYENGDKQAHEQVVEIFGTNKFFDKLVKKIHSIQVKLGIAQEKPEQNKFSLIEIPDHQLTSQKLKLKRIQIYQKNMIQVKKKKQEEKLMQQQKMKDLRQNNPQDYLQQLKEKYKILSQKAKQNERIKNQLNTRKSRLKQKRMQVLARLAEEDYDENNLENQEEMQAFRDPEESDHYSELQVMEAQLRQIDPEWSNVKKDIHHLNSGNQLFLNVDLIKCHEIYFEPRLIGCQQSGLIQTIRASLQPLSEHSKKELLGNVIVIGGGSVIPGLKERIQKDLKQQSPVESKIKVKIGKGGYLGAYLGMRKIGKMGRREIQKYLYEKERFSQFEQNEYIENPWSNPKANFC